MASDSFEKERPAAMQGENSGKPSNFLQEDSAETSTASVLREIHAEICSVKVSDKYEAVQRLRQMLSTDRNPPTEMLIRMGFLRHLIELLSLDSHVSVQFESAWALTNIAAGESSHTLAVVAEGALRPLIALIDSPHLNIAHQALWGIGNIIADNGHFRELAVENGVIGKLVPYLHLQTPESFLRNIAWMLVNMCRTKNPPPSPAFVLLVLPRVKWLLVYHDVVVQTDAVWCLAFLSEGSPELTRVVLQDPSILEIIFAAPVIGNEKYLYGAIRFLGNLLSGEDAQCEIVIKMGFINKFAVLLGHNDTRVLKETLLCIANMAAGTYEQIQKILDVPGLLREIIQFLSSEKFILRKEAVWIIANIVQGGSSDHIVALVDLDVTTHLCDLLTTRDLNLTKILLETICNLMRRCPAESVNRLCLGVESCGGLEKIENLQQHDNDVVYGLSYEIIDSFFKDEDLDESLLDKNASSYKLNMPGREAGALKL